MVPPHIGTALVVACICLLLVVFVCVRDFVARQQCKTPLQARLFGSSARSKERNNSRSCSHIIPKPQMAWRGKKSRDRSAGPLLIRTESTVHTEAQNINNRQLALNNKRSQLALDGAGFGSTAGRRSGSARKERRGSGGNARTSQEGVGGSSTRTRNRSNGRREGRRERRRRLRSRSSNSQRRGRRHAETLSQIGPAVRAQGKAFHWPRAKWRAQSLRSRQVFAAGRGSAAGGWGCGWELPAGTTELKRFRTARSARSGGNGACWAQLGHHWGVWAPGEGRYGPYL